MTPERWREVKKVLAAALELPPDQRRLYLEKACSDSDLRREVESLITAHDHSDFIDLPALAAGTLQDGAKLGPYTILRRIGSGGMGEVYEADDANLRRRVAIKVLPAAFVNDPERLSRFRREARLAASLNHPRIAAVYGLEKFGDTVALVMELAAGPTLAERIHRGPIPVQEAIPVARQITDALEYAHERGVVHRDLKPANITIARDDSVKILDLGLAKAVQGEADAIDIDDSPTVSQMPTESGILLGTAAYMSPEQAKGKPVDRRADIWAFGCVLYEMLTAKKAFPGETVTEALAATLEREPDWSQLPAATPLRVRVLLQRCLQKDPKQRLRDIGDARISLDEVLAGAPEIGLPATGRVSSRRWLWFVSGVAAVLAVTTAYLALAHVRQRPPAIASTTRFEITTPEKFSLSTHYFALSPDGRELAFIGAGTDGRNRIWVRSLGSLEARPLDGTEGADDRPFWSPDSRFIGFFSEGKLKKVDSMGAPPTVICDADGIWGGAWTKDDRILFGSNSGAMIVDASGGKPSQVANGLAGTPLLLPDGYHFIYLWDWGVSNPATGIYLGSVDAKSGQQSKKLLNDDSAVAYVPSSDPSVWRLLFVRGATPATSLGTLMEQRFDTRRLALIGDAIPIAQQVPNLSFGASPDVLAYMTNLSAAAPAGARGDIRGQLTWFDRNGKILEAVGEPGTYRTLALSPDGKRVAFERSDPQGGTSRNLWLYEFARGVTTRFTLDSSWDTDPVWSPDGKRIVFASVRGGGFNLYEKDSNLATQDVPLFKSNDNKLPSSWSPDGRFLLYHNPIPPARIWLLPLGGDAGRKPARMDDSEFNEAFGRVSPDGRWIAYHSDESGRYEIYVRPFDAWRATGASSAQAKSVAGKWMVSKGGGTTALWRGDGKELFYLSLDGNAMAVEVRTSGEFQAGIPRVLFKVPQGVLFWDVSADGKRFLMAAPSEASTALQPKFTVVMNWQTALKQ